MALSFIGYVSHIAHRLHTETHLCYEENQYLSFLILMFVTVASWQASTPQLQPSNFLMVREVTHCDILISMLLVCLVYSMGTESRR